jgi:hypothetical protein
MAGLVVRSGTGRRAISEFREQKMGIVNCAGIGRFTEQ